MPALRRRDDTGATAIELALVLPVAITLIFVALYVGMYYFYAASAEHVARVVGRDASIPTHHVYPSEADEQTVAENAAGYLRPHLTGVSLTPVPAVGEGNALTVTVSYTLPGLAKVGSLLPFLPHPSGDLSRSVTVRYE